MVKVLKYTKVSLVLIVAALITVCVSACSYKNTDGDTSSALEINEKGNFEGNMLDVSSNWGGMMTQSEDKIFYFEYGNLEPYKPSHQYDGEGKIIKENKDGSGRQIVYTFYYETGYGASRFHNLNYLDGYLYFTDPNLNVVRIDENGNGQTILFNQAEVSGIQYGDAEMLLVLENKIVWQLSESYGVRYWYVYDMNTTTNQAIDKEITNDDKLRLVFFDENWIYCEKDLGYDQEKKIHPYGFAKVNYGMSEDYVLAMKENVRLYGNVENQIIYGQYGTLQKDEKEYETYQLKALNVDEKKEKILCELKNEIIHKDGKMILEDYHMCLKTGVWKDKIIYVVGSGDGQSDEIRLDSIHQIDLKSGKDTKVYQFENNEKVDHNNLNFQISKDCLIYLNKDWEFIKINIPSNKSEGISKVHFS